MQTDPIKFKVIHLSDCPETTWKNGGGNTRQIALFPLNAYDYLWRLSSATISMPGPFSNFPGYDRLLILLPGDSVILNSVEHHPSQPIMFKGEDSTYCELKGRPVRDLGLIFRRDLVSATLNVHTLLTGESSLELDSYWNFLYVATGGPIKIDSVLLYQNDILLVTQNQNLRVEAHGPASVYYFAIRLINTL